ncbi:MAG: hypothetical protein ACREQV_21135 [Candidatus Binatia bacterium]
MLRSRLEHEGIVTRLLIHGVPGLSSFNVLVPKNLLHRAQRLLQQQPLSEAELELVATGRPPGGELEE